MCNRNNVRSRVTLAGIVVVGALSNTTAWATPTDKVVTVEGRAAGDGAPAAEQARLDGLRRAVEQACGTFINSQSRTKNYSVVYDKVMAAAAGYVTESEVLSTRVAEGVTICSVRCKVSTAEFEREWARLAHTIEEEGNPRCIVVVVEDDDVDDRSPPKTDGVVQSVLENFFLDKGVQLMDKAATDEVRERDVKLAALNDDVNKMAAVAASFKADVIIRGVAEARRAGEQEISGHSVYKWNATINVRAYHADSAQMLMSNTYSLRKTTTSSSGGGDGALRACAEENAGQILRDIGEAWRKRQVVRRVCQLTLLNCSRADYKQFEEAMSKVEGVQGVKMRELVNNVCQVEIDWSYDVERLVNRIEALKTAGATYEITEQTHDRVGVRVVK